MEEPAKSGPSPFILLPAREWICIICRGNAGQIEIGEPLPYE